MLVHAVLLAVSYILFWVVMCILAPLTVTVHEAGHALLALLLAPGRIHVELGRGERSWRRQLGRLIVTVSLQPRPAGLRGSWVYLGCRRLKPRGRTFYPPTRSYLPMILVTLGGPLASLGLAAACAALDLLTYHVLVRLVGPPAGTSYGAYGS